MRAARAGIPPWRKPKCCYHCRRPLTYYLGRGWLHEDGNVYQQRRMTADEQSDFESRHGRPPSDVEKVVDDHCAWPVDC